MTTALTAAPNGLANYGTYEVPSIHIDELRSLYDQFRKFQSDILIEGSDYGKLPNVEKPCLYKPGAEKLRVAFGLSVQFERTETVEDLNIPYISYSYKATIFSRSGQQLAEQEGNCNSFETKYKYIWVAEADIPDNIDKTKLKTRNGMITEFDFAINKAETSGKYGKPAEYWNKFKEAIADGSAVKTKRTSKDKEYDAWQIGSIVYRIINPEILGLKNTIMKMSQKRAFVGAMIMATGASDSFTQDLEDYDIDGGEAAKPIEVKEPIEPVVKLTKEELLKLVSEVKDIDDIAKLWNDNVHLQNDKDIKDAFGKNKLRIVSATTSPETPDDLIKPEDFDEQKQLNYYLGLLDSATDAKQVEGLLNGFKKDTEYTFLGLESKGQLDGYLARKFPEVKGGKLSVVDEYKTRLNLCKSWDDVLTVAGDIVKEKDYKALKKADKDLIKKYCEEHLKTKFELKEENK